MSSVLNDLALNFEVYQDGRWQSLEMEASVPGELRAENALGCFRFRFTEEGPGILRYAMEIAAPLPSRLRLTLVPRAAEGAWHLIPACIFGTNNEDQVRPGEFPLLTEKHPGESFCSPVWEFRADRAAMPVSLLSTDAGAYGVSIDPYAVAADGASVRSGVFAQLPASFGVSLGYTNRPVHFINKRTEGVSIADSTKAASVSGRIYAFPGEDRTALHRMIREEYLRRRVCPAYLKTEREAADALFDTFVDLNWDSRAGEYTNRHCRPGDWMTMRPWRRVTEIGWTGGAILALPMLMYEKLTPGFTPDRYHGARSAVEHFNRICAAYNPASGLLNDLMVPNDAGSPVNGWWAGFGLTRDCHCAYNSGTAVYALLYAVDFLKSRGEKAPDLWQETAEKVLDTVVSLQRADGAFGYTYATDRKAVLDWEGFAGCWFAAALALRYRLTKESRWLEAAMKALRYYGGFVRDLNCWGTPMDTWKAADQEGNLAFLRACSILWKETKDPQVLEWFRLSADYEYLWRFGYPTRPEHPPIREGWNACGGSITSVSNPHIHPMGVLVNRDLAQLAAVTGDEVHRQRAEDGHAWLMQTLELYPEKTGYGRYGVLSERWCPSDGLLTERYHDGRMYSSWFSYNLWAAANALQAVCERLAGWAE